MRWVIGGTGSRWPGQESHWEATCQVYSQTAADWVTAKVLIDSEKAQGIGGFGLLLGDVAAVERVIPEERGNSQECSMQSASTTLMQGDGRLTVVYDLPNGQRLKQRASVGSWHS